MLLPLSAARRLKDSSLRFQPPEEHGQAEHHQDVADDGAGEGGLDDLDLARAQGHEAR